MVEEQIDYFQLIQSYDRELFELGNPADGNSVLFIGGIHGNEPLGIIALQDVYRVIKNYQIPIHGRIKAIQGNIAAVKAEKRYIHIDMNRVWTKENIESMESNQLGNGVSEHHEMKEVFDVIRGEIKLTQKQFYILDLHTTSAASVSFCVTNVKAECLEFVANYPFPSISGLTGYLEGTLLSYINDMGHVGLAYEAGLHRTGDSLDKHRSFIWYSLVQTGIVKVEDLPFKLDYHSHNLGRDWSTSLPKEFKIINRYKVHEGEEFEMKEGFENFQRIRKGEVLAKNKNGIIEAPCDGHIFMPLYQKSGEDGFFIVQPS
jgi:succinylglutamate desuccinylase